MLINAIVATNWSSRSQHPLILLGERLHLSYKAHTSVSGAELFSHFCTFNYFGFFKIQVY